MIANDPRSVMKTPSSSSASPTSPKITRSLQNRYARKRPGRGES